ncbi:lactate utilization protein [Desulfonatronum thioautotrophicum]|uniref:lactate utilization protein n=1 Tax=Desulfonatronum thioautotrophicum TaxID=617001 RepID=UPI0005EBE965|nr:lactate utilization protein [Desulfonatronum thioautotrophicum]
MSDYLTKFWSKRLHKAQEGLESNNFETYLVDTLTQAREVVLNVILPKVTPRQVAWGGSGTLAASGILEALRQRSELDLLDTSASSLSKDQKHELRRRSLLCDLYFTGTNALTENGQLINLDMHGNRVGALIFGPRHVVVLVGRNKLCVDVEEAMLRVKGFVAPANAARLNMKTPCVKTGFCEDCKSPDRICNVWTITEKSFPKGRIKVVLVNEDLGL